MFRLIIYMMLFSFGWSIGLQALVIPQKATVIATSGAGIGGYIDGSINPAALSYIKPHLGVSDNLWYADISGIKSNWSFGKNIHRVFSIESIGLDDIEHHITNEVDPLGYVEAKWIAVDFSSAVDLNKLINDAKGFSLGYNIKLNYSKLHTERYWGYSIDIGLQKRINNKLSLGFVTKNFGREYSLSGIDKIENYLGLGIAYNAHAIRNNIYFDWIYSNNRNIFKFALKTDFKYVNLVLGTSYSKDSYKDFSYGFNFELRNWAITFGSILHSNSELGTPKSVELKKYF